MNKHIKTTARGLSLLLALLLTLGLLSGCAGENGSSAASQPNASSSSAASGTPESVPASSGKEASSPDASVSLKTITLEVVHKDGTKKEFKISTEAADLRAALEQENLVAGDESEYGLFLKTVDGETVNEADQEWWCLTKGGEMWNNGVDSTQISDGDVFELTFTVGY